MRTELVFGEESRERLMVGVNKLNKAVSGTMGAASRNVMLVDNLIFPQIKKDGVKVAKSINLDDFIEQAGVETVRMASERSADEVGDGTTTAIVLSTAILNEGVKVIKDLNVHEFKEGMDYAYEKIAEELEKDAEDVSENLPKLIDVATISANGDKQTGEVVAKLVHELGSDSEILILEDKIRPKGVYSTIKQGYTFPRGSNQFFETSQGTGITKYTDCKILIVDRYIARIMQIEEAISECADNGHPLIILYATMETNALENLIISKMKTGLKVCAIEFPDAAEAQQMAIMDISSATGATILKDFEKFDKDVHLGELAQFKSDPYNTTLMFKEEFHPAVEEIVTNIKENLDLLDGYKMSDAKERLKRLSKGVGEIRIGYTTNVEYQEVYDRVEDAIGATKSAMKEGIVTGGGVALLKAVSKLSPLTGNKSYVAGAATVVIACQKPFNQILTNAGLTEAEITTIFGQIKETDFTLGYNVRTKNLENLRDLGIVDPKKVTRSALQAAVSVSSTILTTDCIVYPKELSVN